MYCPNQITYVIKRGDTLYALARQFNTSVDMILKLNPSLNPQNLRIGATIAICPNDEFENNNGNGGNGGNAEAVSKAMRLAWLQHIYWTRMYIISAIDKLSDLTATTERLLQNPKVIADIFAENIQALNVITLEDLLTEHLKIGAELIIAIRDNDMKGAEQLTELWYKNADMLAQGLKNANPVYDEQKLRDMLHNHLDMTLRIAALRLAKQHRKEIEVYNDMEQEILSLADYLASGLKRITP